MSILQVTDLSSGYGQKQILNHISFSVEAGHIVGILGANGSGKTTLLKAVSGLLPFTGTCLLENRPIGQYSPKQLAGICGYIPQKSGILLDLTVLDVVLMGFYADLKLLMSPTAQMKEQARLALSLVGLPDREDESFLQLSEGQKQLCILARTFVGNRKLFFMDEPESALDFKFRYHVMSVLSDVVRSRKAGALITLHDSSLALHYCDDILIVSDSKIIANFQPKSTPLSEMEQHLSTVYGSVSLHEVTDRNKDPRIILVKEHD